MALHSDEFLAFLDAAPDAMVIADAAGRIAYVNVETEAMFQYARAELVGRPVEVLIPERFKAEHDEHVDRYTQTPRRRPMGAGLDLYGLRKDGTKFPVEISSSPVVTARGRYLSSVIRDLTAHRDVTQRLMDARRCAEQANQAKSRFLAAASHDLRQPLQTLTLLSNVLSRSVPLSSSAATAVANQSEAVRLMAELVNSLLDISKLEAGVIEPDIHDFAVSRIFSRLRAEFAALAEAKGLELLVDPGDAIVRSDPALLSEIIQNLIGNAIRYTQRGWVSLRCVAANDTVRIEVHDTGVGIPANEIEEIFDEFYQAPTDGGTGAREGAGLGLTIARRMAELLGCSLKASSILGSGSCFSLTVPRSESQPAVPRSPRGAQMTPTFPEGAVVMIVDDDRAVATATALWLGSLKIDCLVASGAAHACELLENRSESPDLLICDYHLGRSENGADVIRTIRKALPEPVPAILISGDTSSSVAEALADLDDCQLVSKPVDTEELLRLCSRSLRERAGEAGHHG